MFLWFGEKIQTMSRPTELINVAVGIVIANQKVLVALRPEHTSHAGLWEFPGGKFEINETAFDALKRELFEEVDLIVHEATPLLCIQHDYGSVKVELDSWLVTQFSNTPHGKEGQEIRWVDHHELMQLTFPEGNRAIVKAVLHKLLPST